MCSACSHYVLRIDGGSPSVMKTKEEFDQYLICHCQLQMLVVFHQALAMVGKSVCVLKCF